VKPDDQLTPEQAGAIARVSAEYIRRLVRSGAIRGKRVGRRLWLIKWRDLELWIAARRRSG
jgi:excisionase family DNA binding protein